MERLDLNSTPVGNRWIAPTTGNYASAMKFLMDSRGFVVGIREVNLDSVVLANPPWKMIAGYDPIVIEIDKSAVQPRVGDSMKNEKKNTFVAPPWLTNLSPFIFLAITVLVLILALKVLPPTLANSLYTYL